MSVHPLTDILEVDGVTVVRFHPEAFSDTNIEDVGEQLFRLAEQGHRNLQLDIGNVEYVGGMGLAKLAALHKKVRAVAGQLTLYNVDASVYEFFQITRLNTVLDIRRKEVA